MNIYSVYIDKEDELSRPLLIKQGFSIYPVIFGFFWALYHRMWFVVFAVLALNFFFNIFDNHFIVLFGKISIFLFFAFFADDMREFYAKKNGMELSDVLLANDEDEAEVKYYMRSEILRDIKGY